MVDPPTGTVTFLFTDIEGSTRLWEQQPQAMHAALARHDALLRHAIETYQGAVFKTVGDQFCAAFPRPEQAVMDAMAAQHALQEDQQPLRVRMAVHTGAAEYRDGDYFGPALNRVARLLAAGHGGQILLSGAAAAQLPPELLAEIDLRSLGVHRLRDITAREAIFQLLAPGLRTEFPPLNTLDVAFRRGMVRAAAIGMVVVAALAGLALTALNQARLANRSRRAEARQRRIAQEGQERLRRHLYASQTTLAQRELDAANRAAGRGVTAGPAARSGAGGSARLGMALPLAPGGGG